MLTKIYNFLDAEHDRLILFAPVFIVAGSVTYFSLQDEPPLWLGALLCIFCAVAYRFTRKSRLLRYACIIAALVSAGVLLGQIRTASIEPTALSAPLNFAHVKGKLESIEQTPKGSKIILKDVAIEELPTAKTPSRISLTLRQYDASLTAGQIITTRAGLFPPPQPALPGGFDFARHYYFKNIGAVGYGIPPLVATPLAQSGESSLAIYFAELRHRITDAIRAHFSEPAGSIAAAFITGQTQSIPQEVNDEMRIVGLYHLLAVSGLNLSIVAGIAFFGVRLLLASVPAISLRYPIKKWAAIIALVVSYLYLEIAGAPVSAERAFLMVSLIFLAIILDRDPSPMRSIAASAFIILCFTPEAALSASFQLSYSATAALIASYEWGTERLRKRAYGWGIARVFFYFAAVIATSLVAWLGTEPFIIYNFNQFSSYSLLANTIAEPLVSFLLMPLVVAGILLMPLGLSALAFTPMQYGLDALLALTHWIAGLPYAMIIVPSPTDAGFIVALCGIIWLYFWKSRWRILGIPVAIAGMCTAFSYVPPDILVSGDGKHIAVRMENGSAAMLKGRAGSFIAGQWARAMLVNDMLEKKEADAECDKQGCMLGLHRHRIALPRTQEALGDDCEAADILIAPALTIDKASCRATLIIDQASLETGGSVSVTFKEGKPAILYANALRGNRPWKSNAASEE